MIKRNFGLRMQKKLWDTCNITGFILLETGVIFLLSYVAQRATSQKQWCHMVDREVTSFFPVFCDVDTRCRHVTEPE